MTDRLNNIKSLARIVAANQTWRSFRRVLIAMNATKEEIDALHKKIEDLETLLKEKMKDE